MLYWGDEYMITVNTLGKFQITDGKSVLNDDNIRSTMLTKLLVYLIIHRKQSISMEELTEAMWQEEEVENPTGALKNLMYRLRNLLKGKFGEINFILTNRGSYCWNLEVKLAVDVEEFERLLEQAKKAKANTETAMHYYEEAIKLYQGNFMANLVEMHWVITMNTFYHSLYLTAVKSLSDLYMKTERYDELEILCNEALKFDKVDEQLHYYLIYARMKRNKYKLAIESYERACKILKEELGIRKSSKLQELYGQLLSARKGSKAEDIAKVQADMIEESADGVFFCGYPVFKEIYRLEARKNIRNGVTEYVLLLTLKNPSGEDSESQMAQFRIRNAMNKLEDTLKSSLRIGDVAAKYSDSQFVVLLTTCSYESGLLVANRIVSKFYHDNAKYRTFDVQINLEEVTLAGKL